jgi:hypothetical protein
MNKLNRHGVPAGAILTLVLMAGAAPALAQDALGDGRILEKDLRVNGVGQTSSGLAPRANFRNEVQARNAAVTGNAPNGRSLRINSPYSAPNDFRGRLGTDDLFSFQRDSLASTAPYRGQQYLNTFTGGIWKPATRLDTYGAASELPKYGNDIGKKPALPYSRQRNNANPDFAGDSTVNQSQTTNGKDTGPVVDNPVGTLRSTGAFQSTLGLNQAVVGYQRNAGVTSRVTASGLLGLRLRDREIDRPTERQVADADLQPTASQAMGLDASQQRLNTSAASNGFKTTYDDLKVRLTTDTAKNATTPPRLQPAGTPPDKSDKATDKQPDNPSGKPGADAAPKIPTTWEERMQQLRGDIAKAKADNAKKAAEKPKTAGPKGTGTTDQQRVNEKNGVKPDETAPDGTPRPGAPKDDKKKRSMAGLDEETLEIIRKAGAEAKTYSAGNPNSAFENHLKVGEDALAKGRYFDAEERFSRALALRPGDATVQAARLNAQIGAGLYVSAASNLRLLYEAHPEVIGMRYTGSTVPGQDRLKATIGEMRENIAKAKREGMPPPDEAAMLLAYLGYQTADAAATREGIAALRETKNGASDPLVPLLDGVWISKDAK